MSVKWYQVRGNLLKSQRQHQGDSLSVAWRPLQSGKTNSWDPDWNAILLTSLVFHRRRSLGRVVERGRHSSSLLGRNTFLCPLFSVHKTVDVELSCCQTSQRNISAIRVSCGMVGAGTSKHYLWSISYLCKNKWSISMPHSSSLFSGKPATVMSRCQLR